jgi:glycosyltransferase involved in cell wall biosynthesis
MRLLHLYAGNLYGGIERVLATLARERHRCPDMLPHFALCFDGRLAKELRDTGAPLTMLGEARVSRPWTVAAARTRLRQLLDRQSFDAAICHSYWPHGMFAPVVRSRGIPLVYWSHDVPNGKGWLERWARRTRPDLVLANSEFTARSIDMLFPGAKTVVQRYPVPAHPILDRAATRACVRQSVGTTAHASVVITVCRLERWKGHTLLLKALALINPVLDWQCWIVGGPQRPAEETYLEELRRLAAAAGVAAGVKFLGQRDDVPELLTAADIHCQPNTGPEPFGVAFVEALSAGLPVVTTGIGAAPEIVTEECGRLVAPEALALEAVLEELIASSEPRRRLSTAAPARAAALCDVQSTMEQLHHRMLGACKAARGAA